MAAKDKHGSSHSKKRGQISGTPRDGERPTPKKDKQDRSQSKKRKQISSTPREGERTTPKKQKFSPSKPGQPPSKVVKKNFSPKFASSKPGQLPVKGAKKTFNFSKSDKSSNFPEKKEPLSKREGRLLAKELAEARKKKRKRHYTLEQELASLWEKMRRRNISKEERSTLITKALQKMKGKIPEIASSHVSSRVLQTCVKYCSQSERDDVYEELRPHFLTMACNTYSVHLVKKMLDNASKKQLEAFISSLHGHVASLLRHMVGSVVIEQAYQLGNAPQKQRLLLELYSTELQLFKDLVSTKESRLIDLISKLGLQKASVIRHMTSLVQPILEKGIVDHSIIHRSLVEYFSIADKSSATDVIQQLSGPLLVRMIHTKDGVKVGILCVKHGSAKERKKIIKGMKGHIGKIAQDQCGTMVLICILSVVDDTKLITKIIVRELQNMLKELVLDKNGRRPLLQLLHPNCHRYFSPDELASLNLSIPSLCTKGENSDFETQAKSIEVGDTGENGSENVSEVAVADPSDNINHEENLQAVDGGKKDPFIRRLELLVDSGLAESLILTCIENAGELIRSNFGKEVIYEVATGGAGGVLWSTLADRLNALHEAIASLAALPKSDESEEEHVLENFHSSRTIRKLVMDCSTFASTLWKIALEGKCELWAQGHSCKVVCAFLESSDTVVRDLAKSELQPLIDGGSFKVPDTKLAES
ncbi:pumilio homolog 24 isoform X2 [Telopea speciosissima]|uniref:pumilio homolog 24 isoform X2 n=1 Tax=Telopea speciosissima TaxID=54955 RepID=UPI001CC771E1|nr:pumilio homolog 24 isoform X2 [Telopea speciosissima]